MPTISPRFGLLAKDSSGAGDSKDHEVAKGTSKKNSNKNAKPKCTAKKPQKGTPYLGCFFLTAFVFPTKLPAVSTRYTWVCPRSFSAGCQGMVRQKNSLPQRADLTALCPHSSLATRLTEVQIQRQGLQEGRLGEGLAEV